MSLIVEKAGGIVTDYMGNRKNIYKYFNRDEKSLQGCLPSVIVSTDAEIHREIVSILKK